MSTPKLIIFPFFGFQEFEKKHVNTKTSQFSQFFGFQEFEKKHVNTKTSQFFPIFWIPGVWEKTCQHQKLGNFTYVYSMILLYLEGSGSKFHSVNTKTSQFSTFFGVQELRKKHVNTKTSQFPPFFGFQELRKNMSTPKLVNFHHFLDSRSWEKTYIYIYNMYICTYVYSMILLYLESSGSKFHSVNTKTSQFSSFFGVQEWRKKHVNTKTSQFPPFFGFQKLRKKYVNTKTSQCSPYLDSRSWEKICVYIFIIRKYVHNVYYMILLYLEGSGSKFHSVNTKTSQFSPFLDSRSWEKTCVYIICINVHMYIPWFCYIWRVVVLRFIPSTPKLVNFLHFLDSRSLRKTCQHQN